jgi:hypothetical protein
MFGTLPGGQIADREFNLLAAFLLLILAAKTNLPFKGKPMALHVLTGCRRHTACFSA